MTVRAHVTAILALVDAVPNVNVYDAIVPNEPALPYVVIRTNAGARERSGLLPTSDTLTMTVWATSIGETREQAQWLSEKVVAALLDVRPTVSSRSCHPIELVNSQPARIDDTSPTSLVYVLDEFRLVSIPA